VSGCGLGRWIELIVVERVARLAVRYYRKNLSFNLTQLCLKPTSQSDHQPQRVPALSGPQPGSHKRVHRAEGPDTVPAGPRRKRARARRPTQVGDLCSRVIRLG
jgi:hypothetical protein